MSYEIGVQSFTYRNFSIDEIQDELAGTAVDAIELCDIHVDPSADDTTVASVRETFEEIDVDICGYGVHDFESADAVRPVFSFASDLGADYVSVNFQKDDEAVADALTDAAAEFDLFVGVHNHGPEAVYSTADDVLAVVEDRPSRFGACVDTGHFFRSEQSLKDVTSPLDGRVHALHLKDFVDIETEVIPGDGNLDISLLLNLLDEHTSLEQPLVIEYEEDPNDPTPAVEVTAQRIRDTR